MAFRSLSRAVLAGVRPLPDMTPMGSFDPKRTPTDRGRASRRLPRSARHESAGPLSQRRPYRPAVHRSGVLGQVPFSSHEQGCNGRAYNQPEPRRSQNYEDKAFTRPPSLVLHSTTPNEAPKAGSTHFYEVRTPQSELYVVKKRRTSRREVARAGHRVAPKEWVSSC
jgi:hypothetical protein